MADIDLDKMSFGVDTSKLRVITQEIESDFNAARDMVKKGTYYDAVISAVNAHWAGEDKTVFIERFKKNADYISKAIDSAKRGVVDTMKEFLDKVDFKQNDIKTAVEDALGRLN